MIKFSLNISFALCLVVLLTGCSSKAVIDTSLTSQIKPWKEGADNSKARTQLRNATHRACTDDALRLQHEANLIHALQNSKYKSVKSFFIHELKLCGGVASIKPLSVYLLDDDLGRDAAIAMLAIDQSLEGEGASSGYFSEYTVSDAVAEKLPLGKGENLLMLIKAAGSLNRASADTLKVLTGFLASDNKQIKLAAVRSIACIADEASSKALLAAVKGEKSYVRSKILSYNLLYARNLAKDDEDEGSSHALKVMAQVDRSKEDHSFINCLSTFDSILKEKFTSDLINYLSNENLRIRTAVADILIDSSDESLNDKLKKVFSSKPVDFQVQALKILVTRGDDSAASLTAQSLKSKDGHLRSVAAELSVSAHPAIVLPPLIDMVIGGTADDRTNAAAAIKRIPSASTGKELVKYFSKADDGAKAALLDIFSGMRSKEISETVLAATLSSDKDVKKAAFKALKNVAMFEQVSRFVSMLVNSSSSSDMRGYQTAIVAASAENKDSSSSTVLESVKNNSSAKANISLIEVLGRIGGKKALEGLQKLYINGSEAVQTAVVRALSKWESIDQVAQLLSFAADTEGKNKILMVRGISSVIVSSSKSVKDKASLLDQLLAISPDSEKDRLSKLKSQLK